MRRKFDSASPMAVLPTTFERSSPSVGNVTIVPPTNFSSHSSTLGATSPGSLSPLVAIRRDSMAQGSPLATSHDQPSVETSVERSTESLPGHTFPRIVRLERSENRMLHSIASELMTDPKALRSRSSPQHSFGRSIQIPGQLLHQDLSVSSHSSSSVSSTISNSGTTGNSAYTSVTPFDEGRSQRSLPPLSTVGLNPILPPSYAESCGQAMHTPLSSQMSTAYTLPPPLNSPFVPSPSSSGKQCASQPVYPHIVPRCRPALATNFCGVEKILLKNEDCSRICR